MSYKDEYKDSEHIGQIKERIEVDIKVKKIFHFENEFGSKKIYHMSADGNYLVWFCSSQGLDEGFEGKVRLTVKDHTVYNGVKQTIVNRVAKVKEKILPDAVDKS